MKETGLIGYTGFVGSNIMGSREFDCLYNSKNIEQIKGKEFSLLICSGIPASMWLANNEPSEDRRQIEELVNVLKTVRADRFILISTVAVYEQPVVGVDEGCGEYTQLPYGRNRLYAEEELSKHFGGHILRLPALFGSGLKKNFIYDLMNPQPSFIPSEGYGELMEQMGVDERELMSRFYKEDDHGRYVYEANSGGIDDLVGVLRKHGRTSLEFTNPASRFQFYNLAKLWGDVEMVMSLDVPLLNVCSEPLSAADIAKEVSGVELTGGAGAQVMDYDVRSQYAKKWGSESSYLYGRDQVLSELREFVGHKN